MSRFLLRLVLASAALLLAAFPSGSAIAEPSPPLPEPRAEQADSPSDSQATRAPSGTAEASPTAVGDASGNASRTVEQVAALSRASVVVVTMVGRDGNDESLGSGFVISSDGLIVTNLHVIGDSRPVFVQFVDGRKFPVTAVHATEKAMDLAILKIDATDLIPLELADSKDLNLGETVVAVGNPVGLQHSVVSGVMSERRMIEGRPMLQLAIPIERGNSGGPVLDLRGRVQGVITLKSLVTNNLGFAVSVDALKPLVTRPNPVPMQRWVTLGSLDKRRWTTLFGATWKQRAGRILTENIGTGFGGRALCLSTQATPEIPFEVAVQVRFTPGSGAAGLVFHADGGDRHYGFYPSNGRLRLTRFNGPSVYSWKVLDEVASDAYLPDDWNTIKVRIEEQRLLCYVNDVLVIESTDRGFTTGQVGLAKFRETEAEFRGFQVAAKIDNGRPSEEIVQRINALVADLSPKLPPSPDLINQVAPVGIPAVVALRDEAQQLEDRAKRLREVASAVHTRTVQNEMADVMNSMEGPVDLLRASLLVARLDNEEVDVDHYVSAVDQMVADIKSTLPAGANEKETLAGLNRYLFEEHGYHGSRTNYYHRSNSYLNEVIEDREGLPITISVLYIEMARRLGLNVVGIGLPGHFVVRFEPKAGHPMLLDPFDAAHEMSIDEAHTRIRERINTPVDDDRFREIADQFLQASTPDAIVVRMLTNLRSVAEDENDFVAVLRYLDVIIALRPDDLQFRAERIGLQVQQRRLAAAIADIDWMLERRPDGLDVNRVMELRAGLEAKLQGVRTDDSE